MINHLKELIKVNNTIILPDLGAIIVSRKASHADYMFNEFLKFNDGLLVKHVASEEKLSVTDATHLVNDFVNTIKEVLEKGNNFSLGEIGSLKKIDGKIVFETPSIKTPTEEPNKKEIKPIVETKKEELLKSDEVKENPLKIAVEDKNTEVSKSLDNEKKKASNLSVEEKIKEDKKKIIQPQKEQKKTIEDKVIPTDNKNKENIKSEKKVLKQDLKTPETSKVKVNEPKPEKKKDTKEKKKKWPIILGLVLGLVIVGGGITMYLYPELLVGESKVEKEDVIVEEVQDTENTEGIESNDLTTLEDEELTGEEIIEEEVAENEYDEEEVVSDENVIEEEEISSETGVKYYVVAGIFSKEENAKSHLKTLKKKGFSDAHLAGMHKGNYLVVFGEFNTRSEANLLKDEIVEFEKKAWVLKK